MAEIKAIATWACKGGSQILPIDTGDIVLKHHQSNEEIKVLFNRLGGSIKLCEILPDSFEISTLLTEGVKKFGVSSYEKMGKGSGELADIAKGIRKQIKQFSKESGVRIRYIGKGTEPLSSGQISATDLLIEGFELVIFRDDDRKIKIARTVAIQDLEEFTKRDMYKPYNNVEMGMLPPKLARIMLNLTGLRPGATIWDPFCGSGAIVTEGLLLGFDMIGSDIDLDAVEGTKRNVDWLSREYDLKGAKYNILEQDVTGISRGFQKTLRNTEIHAVVFEPYMGPALRREISLKYANELLEDVRALYNSLLDVLGRIRKPGLKVVSVFPVYRTHQGWVTNRYNEVFPSKWNIHSISSEQEVLHWDRSNSIIRRNLVVARLKH